MAYVMYIEDVLFPVTPGKISVKVNGQNETVTLINEGEVNIIKSPGLTDISIDELLLPALQNYPFAVYDGGFHNAKYYMDKLEAWKKSKNPVKWKMIRLAPKGTAVLWDSSMEVTIEDYEIVEDADEKGLDVVVKLELKQYREFTAKKLKIKKKSKSGSKKTKAKKQKSRPGKKTAEKDYTVKKGDCMQSIAKKKLGSASRWKEIYNLNKKTMNTWAKKYGHKSAIEGSNCWIFPGEKLKLPK